MSGSFFRYSFFAFFCSHLAAQDIDLGEMRKLYPEENALILKHAKVYTINLEDKKLQVNAEGEEEGLALNDVGVSYINSRNLYSSFFIKNTILEAKTLSRNESGKYKTYKATDISEKSATEGHVFFDDSKTTTISYPSVTAGSITTLKSNEEYTDAKIFGVFYFSGYIPTLQSEVTVKMNKNVQLRYYLKNCDGLQLEFTKTTKGKYNYYTWKAKDLAKYHTSDMAPNLRYFIPHIIFFIPSYVDHGDTTKVLSSPKELYSWYSQTIKGVNSTSSEALKKISDSLTVGCKSEFQKVQKIFYWVQDNIKYIAFEDGLGGLVPREANAIYEKRYGDCKDMASIITQMLSTIHVKSYLTWIGTRDIPYRYSEIPTPIVDNHMIAAYKDSTGKVWLLDATGKNATMQLYTSMIQGKQALIGIDSSSFELFDVPVVSKEKNMVYDSLSAEIKNGELSGNGELALSGYPKIHIDYLYSNLTAEEFKKELTETLNKGNNTFWLDSYDIEQAGQREKATQIKYKYKINNFVKSYNDETYFNFHLDKKELKYLVNDSRGNVPIEMRNTIHEITCVELKLPEGFDISFIPDNTSYSNKDFGFSIEYFKSAQTLTMKKYFYCNKLMINPDDFGEWTRMLKFLNKSYNESIILKHK
ncbi:MAG TPA: DUF3857 domain-containing protein [Bacteroidia bacterium]|jgi:transglutaminase-like putative cysteine protease|nr:DUF3857 domain-containing protein [Bacteroidia bacterium]